MLSADCRGLAGAGLSPAGVTCCLAAFILFSSPSSDPPEGDDGRWKGAWESCTIEMDGAAKKLFYLALSQPAPPLFKLHLYLSHHALETCSHKTEPQEGPTIIFSCFSLPFKISVARISKKGKLHIVRSLPTHPGTKNPLHRQNWTAQGTIPESQYSDHIKLGRFSAHITHGGKNCKQAIANHAASLAPRLQPE